MTSNNCMQTIRARQCCVLHPPSLPPWVLSSQIWHSSSGHETQTPVIVIRHSHRKAKACKGNLHVNIKRQPRNGNLISSCPMITNKQQTSAIFLRAIADLHPVRNKVNRRAVNGGGEDGDPKITVASTNNPPFSLKQHNHTIKAPLPFPHCLISAGYLRYLCGCSYL